MEMFMLSIKGVRKNPHKIPSSPRFWNQTVVKALQIPLQLVAT